MQKKPENVSKRLKGITRNQEIYIECLESGDIVLCSGPAGTGKTYISCGVAARGFTERKYDTIVITRPMVLCGMQKFGATPGTVEEKLAPHVEPLIAAFGDFLGGKNNVRKLVMENRIRLIPLEFMRGHSIEKSFVICDEAQNADARQLKMLLTRIGSGSKIVVTGDITQNDIVTDSKNPLLDAIERFGRNFHKLPVNLKKKVCITRLTHHDVVRHELVRWVDESLSDGDQSEVEHFCTHEPVNIVSKQKQATTDDFICPNCKVKVVYDLTDEDSEQVECWSCTEVIEIPEFFGEDFYVGTTRTNRCVMGRRPW